jgi:hypothetical protein
VTDIIENFRAERAKEGSGLVQIPLIGKTASKRKERPVDSSAELMKEECISKAEARIQDEERNVYAPVITQMPKDPWAQILMEVQPIALQDQDEDVEAICFNVCECHPEADCLILCSVSDDDPDTKPLRRSTRAQEAAAKKQRASAERMIQEEVREQQEEEKRMRRVLRRQEKADKKAAELGAQQDKELSRIDQREDVARAKLNQFNGLVNKFFLFNKDEEHASPQLYLVVNTFRSKTKDRFMATAIRYYNGKDNLMQDQEVVVLPILGLDGVQALVADYDNRLSIPEGMEIPRKELQWLQVQQTEWNEEWEPAEGDLDYRQLFNRLAEGGEVTVLNPKQA